MIRAPLYGRPLPAYQAGQIRNSSTCLQWRKKPPVRPSTKFSEPSAEKSEDVELKFIEREMGCAYMYVRHSGYHTVPSLSFWE
jgi:hypothetical protein